MEQHLPDLRKTLRHITWRGVLRSCNYTCSYCPFAKKDANTDELLRDQAAMDRLLRFLEQQPCQHQLSVLLAPYGEGLVHRHYQQGLCALSRCPQVARVSCQTNLSMDAGLLLAELNAGKADFSRLALWASFHPAMTKLETFAEKVRLLSRYFPLAVGVVGNPAHLPAFQRLHELLPEQIRQNFWINAMDGLARAYTKEEEQALMTLAPAWDLERKRFPAHFTHCGAGRQSIFLRADGAIYPCNRSPIYLGNLYNQDDNQEGQEENKNNNQHKNIKYLEGQACKGRCDCFLAYSNRKDIAQLFSIGPWPQLRLGGLASPDRIQALFLDLDGTLTEARGQIQTIRPTIITALEQITQHHAVYLATALPAETVRRKYKKLWSLLAGGVFAYGADICDFRLQQNTLHPLPTRLDNARRSYASADGRIYKQILRKMPETIPPGCQVIAEQCVFSLCAKGVDKLAGVRTLCKWNGWQADMVVTMGNGASDATMLNAYPFSIAPPGARPQAKQAARFHMHAEDFFAFLLAERKRFCNTGAKTNLTK